MSKNTEPSSPKPTSVYSAVEGLYVPPLKANDHPCLQNELQGDTASATLCAGRHLLSERLERSKPLRWNLILLDTSLPLQPGLHSTSVGLHPQLTLGHVSLQRSHEPGEDPAPNPPATTTISDPSFLAVEGNDSEQDVPPTTEAAHDVLSQPNPSESAPLADEDSGAAQATTRSAPPAAAGDEGARRKYVPKGPSSARSSPLAGKERHTTPTSSSSAPLAVAGSESNPESAITAGDDRTASPEQRPLMLAPSVLGPVARADPVDQENNIFRAQAALDDPASTTARPMKAEAPAANHATPAARRRPAEAVPGQAISSRGDTVRVCQIIRDDSPLKNETVCFCDESKFRYFGCLLRPEILMIPTPVPSLEEALRFSDSHETPLSRAVQLRLVIELSSHYATHYQTVMQYVVATPSIGGCQDVWTFGILKLLVQMQVLLACARLIMRPRESRSVTYADVVALKRYLRDHHHLNLRSRPVPRAEVAPYTLQQQHSSAAEVPDAARLRTQLRLLPKQTSVNAKDGTTDAAMHAGPACPSGKSAFRQCKGPQDGSAGNPSPSSHRRLRYLGSA